MTVSNDELLARIQRLEDRQAILDCIHRYCRGIDRHDDDIIASVFHEDAIDNHGSFIGGIKEFIRFANDGHAKTTLSHTHNITCHSVDIDGDVAHAESYVIFALRLPDEKTVHVGGGRYIDRLEKRNGEWKIALRRLVMDWRLEADGTAWAKRPSQSVGKWDKTDLSYARPFVLTEEQKALLAQKAQQQ